MSGVKEFSHHNAGDLLGVAELGRHALEEVALDAFHATGIAARLSVARPRARGVSLRESRSLGLHTAAELRTEQQLTADSWKLQAYHYFGRQAGATEVGCPEHVDSGVLTVVVHHGSRGLQVFDQLTEQWITVEETRTSSDAPALAQQMSAVILVGHTLEVASGGAYRAALHRVDPEHARRSLVYKLHMRGEVWLPEPSVRVAELLRTFSRTHATVNPLPNDERVSAVGGSTSAVGGSTAQQVFVDHAVVYERCPTFLCMFREGDIPSSHIAVRIHGLSKIHREHPVLLNPYHTLWVLKCAEHRLGIHLASDVRRKILGLATWTPTSAASVLRTLALRTLASRNARHELRLVTPSGLIGLHSPNVGRPLVDCFQAGPTFAQAVVPDLLYICMATPEASAPGFAPFEIVVKAAWSRFNFEVTSTTRTLELFYAIAAHFGSNVRMWKVCTGGMGAYDTNHAQQPLIERLPSLHPGQEIGVVRVLLGD